MSAQTRVYPPNHTPLIFSIFGGDMETKTYIVRVESEPIEIEFKVEAKNEDEAYDMGYEIINDAVREVEKDISVSVKPEGEI